MSATGRGTVRRAHDFYETPAWCTQALLGTVDVSGSVIEPAAGSGAIARVLNTVDAIDGILCVEVQPDLCEVPHVLGDFLDLGLRERTDWVVGNPPYSQALEFIEHSFTVAESVAMLLRLNFLGSQRRAQWHREHPSDIFVLPKRPSFTGGGTDACEYAWFVWGPGRGGHWSILNLSEVAA